MDVKHGQVLDDEVGWEIEKENLIYEYVYPLKNIFMLKSSL